ncbi:MAG: class I SAM-dependent methyltransferase, partial [Gammaproteobacteria bacterium]
MKRIPEPELMTDPAQAAAYAAADFSEPHNLFIEKFGECFPEANMTGHVLDLGCGPADISIRFARAYPECQIDAVDGSACMLKQAEIAIKEAGLSKCIHLIEGVLPEIDLPRSHYDAIISNSLLHHLHHPEILWQTVKTLAQESSIAFVMDLVRPADEEAAKDLVTCYVDDEPAVLQRGFYNSLCAAFTLDEIKAQLQAAGLDHYMLGPISDRHVIIY